MHNIIFNMAGMHRHGTAFYDFLRLRKTFFVDQLGWDIPHDDEVEMDQYDNPQAWYTLVLNDDGEVVGGARNLPTTATWGSHSYMLKDASEGKLGSIPPNVMSEIVVNERVWETTRMVISDSLQTHAERTECLDLIVSGIQEITTGHGATEVLCLTLPPMVRALRSLGWPAERRGAPYHCPDDGRTYAVLAIPPRTRLRSSQAATPASLPTPTHRAQPAMVHAPQKD